MKATDCCMCGKNVVQIVGGEWYNLRLPIQCSFPDGLAVKFIVPHTFIAHSRCYEKYGKSGDMDSCLPAIPRIGKKIQEVLQVIGSLHIETQKTAEGEVAFKIEPVKLPPEVVRGGENQFEEEDGDEDYNGASFPV